MHGNSYSLRLWADELVRVKRATRLFGIAHATPRFVQNPRTVHWA